MVPYIYIYHYNVYIYISIYIMDSILLLSDNKNGPLDPTSTSLGVASTETSCEEVAGPCQLGTFRLPPGHGAPRNSSVEMIYSVLHAYIQVYVCYMHDLLYSIHVIYAI